VEHALKELQTADQAFKEAEARLKVAKKNLSIALRS
jgi:exonuclease VII small subunit